MNKKIPLALPWIGEEEAEAVREVLQSRWIIQGPKVEQFEEALRKYVGTKYAVAVNSGTAALHTSLTAMGIGAGDEVIVPSFSFIATANVVVYLGAKPVFADIDAGTYNIDFDDAKKRITRKTKAIIVVHQFGNPADMDAARELSEDRDLPIVEDAACAHGAKYDDRRVGSFGVAGCFSFHPRKVITTGEGGMITTNDEQLAERARAIRSHGMGVETWKRTQASALNLPSFELLGYNYRMSDLAAAIGLVQMKKIDEAISRRRKIAAVYNQGLGEVEDLKPPACLVKGFHVYQSYVAVVDRPELRDRLIANLKERGISAQAGTQAIHLESLYRSRFGYAPGQLPRTEAALRSSLSLPIFPELTEEEVDLVLSSIKESIR